jgi:hypothetical protein
MATTTQAAGLHPNDPASDHTNAQGITETRTGDNSEVASATIENVAGGDLEKAEGHRKYKPGEKWKSQEVHLVPHK